MDRLAVPTDFMASVASIKFGDLTRFVQSVFDSLDVMRPIELPAPHTPSADLAELLDRKTPISVPAKLKPEFEAHYNARTARANARSENQRRIRVLLKAESYMREVGDPRWETLRAFNRDVWGVIDRASSNIAERALQEQDVS